MFHDLPHWALKLLGVLLSAAVFFLLLSLSHIPSSHAKDSVALSSQSNAASCGTGSSSDWNLTLVNPWTPLPAGHTITVTQLRGGQSIDQRCYPALQAMMDACRAAGHQPVICSSYRPHNKQEALFANKVQRLMAAGYDAEEADQRPPQWWHVPAPVSTSWVWRWTLWTPAISIWTNSRNPRRCSNG